MTSTRVRTTFILWIVALLAFAAISWFLVLGPRLATAANLTSQTEQVEFATTSMQSRYRQTVEQAATATETAVAAQALFETMPQQAELPDVLLQIIDAAARAEIDAKDISVINSSVPRSLTGNEATGADPESPAGAAAKGLGVELAQLDIDVTVNGNRDALLSFLDNVQRLDRAMLVTVTGLESVNSGGSAGPENAPSSGKSGELSLSVTGSMFVLQSKLPDLVAAVEKVIADSGIESAGAAAPGT